MSTSNQQQRGGRRQPFGFLHANTLSSAKAKGSGATAGNAGGAAAAAHPADPVKNESKKKFRGVLTSIVSRSKGKKSERSSSEEDVSMLESPSKKTRVMMEDESELNAGATATAAPAMPPMENKRSGPLRNNEFAPGVVAGIIRQQPAVEDADNDFWDDEMEDMLELKQANPILSDSVDDEEDNIEEGMIDDSRSLAKEPDENVSGEPLLSSNRLQEGKDGFKIHEDK